MAGNSIGGKKAAAKNLANDPLFYKKIGSKGGKNGNTGGFAVMAPCDCMFMSYEHHKGQCAGKRGGLISRRKPRQK